MKKLIATILALALCGPLVAEPIMFVCERPTWGDDEGCGPNKTRYTYGFLIDDEDFSPERSAAYENKARRPYAYAEARGCDLARTSGKAGEYLRTDKGFLFLLDFGREVELHPDTMQAKLFGNAVKHSPYMSCTAHVGEDIESISRPPSFVHFLPTHSVQRPTSPTTNPNSDRSRQ